jgi:TrpR-related protein YerC/YecD
MIDTNPEIWNTPRAEQFTQVLVSINDAQAMQSFLRDILTESEIVEISARFEAARMLASGAKYAEIIKATKLSSRTIARISDWIQNGTGGYALALKNIDT